MKDKLKKLRLDAGFSQDTLSKEIGVSKTCISAWENGTRSPSGQHILAYAEIFDLDEDFFEDIFPPESNVKNCFDITVLNARGAKKLYDFYLELIKDNENLKKY